MRFIWMAFILALTISVAFAKDIDVAYIDIIDSPTDPKISYVVVEYTDGTIDRMQVDRKKFLEENGSEDIPKAAMVMIKARLKK